MIAQEIFGVNRHIRAGRRRLRRGRLRDHRALFVRPHPPRHRTRLQRGGSPGRPRLPAADSEGEDAARPHRLASTWSNTRAAWRWWAIAGAARSPTSPPASCRCPARCRTTAGRSRITSTSRRARPVMYHFGEKDPHIPLGRHREDPRRRSQRHLPPLSGRPWFQLRGARQLRRGQRAARARAHAAVPGRANGEANDQAQRSVAVEGTRLHRRRSGCAADSGQTTEIRNPANGELLGTVPNMGAAETRRAIEAAHAAHARLVEEDRRRAREDHARAGSISCWRMSTTSPSS